MSIQNNIYSILFDIYLLTNNKFDDKIETNEQEAFYV